MPRVTKAEFLALKKKSEDRKAKRKAKARQLWGVAKAMTKTAIKKKLWTLVSLYVRMRDNYLYGKCRICGIRPIQCAYHLIPSNDGAATRYDPEAIVGGCDPCNYGERMHRFKYRLKHIEIFGAELIARLEAKATQIVKYSAADLLALCAYFKAKIESQDWKP